MPASLPAALERSQPVAPTDILAQLRPTELPAPPEAALRVMHACSDPKSDARGIAALVSADPMLTAELLRIVNSAYFGFSTEVASVARAVSILGQRALRHYVLCVAVRDALDAEALHGSDVSGFWRASLARAVAARAIGEATSLDAEECFTAGLLLDIGLPALFHARPDLTGYWDGFVGADPDVRLVLERDTFGITHEQAGVILAEAWGLPARLRDAIGAHHALAPTEGSGELVGVARAADLVAAIYREDARRADVDAAREAIATHAGLEGAPVDALLATLPEQTARAAEALGFDLPRGPELDALLRDANRALIEHNVTTQELNWRLQSALDERDAVDTRLRGEIELARVVQRSLLPAAPRDGSSEAHFSGLNAPARELSGDFYDHFPIAGGRSQFCLADVSGKGMDAALLMAKTSSLFHCLGKLVHDPGKLLGLVTAELAETSVRGMFVTLIAGIYDPEAGTVVLVNAGHPPAVLVDPRGKVTMVEAGAPPLGVVPGQSFEAETHSIEGHSLYLFSDGLIEAPDRSGGQLGYPGLVDALCALGSTPREERPARVLNRIGETHDLRTDDVTMLLLEG